MFDKPGRRAPGAGARGVVLGVIAACWIGAFLGGSAFAQDGLPAPAITAASVFAVDPETGEVILQLNPDEHRLIGSVTKVATALVVIDHTDLADEVTVTSADMVGAGFSAMGLQPGDTLTVEQLLTGLLIVSGGDAAQALGHHVGAGLAGNEDPDIAMDAFVEAMNQKAAELGLADTQFANPDGDDTDGAWSTARDVASLYIALEENPVLAGISAQTEYSFNSAGPEQTPYTGVSTNQLAGQYNVISAKTGSTIEAGGCIVLSRTVPGGTGREIVAILGSNLEYDETWTPTIDDRWTDATTVMDTIDANWTPGQFIAEAPVATNPPVAAAPALTAGDAAEPKPLVPGESDPDDVAQPSKIEGVLIVTVAGGVLAFASAFAWGRVTPPRP